MTALEQEVIARIQSKVTEVEIDIDLQLRGWLATSLVREAEQRGVKPADLLANIIEAVIHDRLFKAILDD